MPTPEELEAAADRLRACARDGRAKAQSLATHLDTVATTAGDDTVWKGTYPTHAAADLKDDQSALGRAADLLRADADAWDRKATGLDQDATEQRAKEKKEAAEKAKADDAPGKVTVR